ncbi:hypothetical protein BOX15_Mlig023358g1 [Macrostomum lignano]|uniref:Uncharacterized protein n=1 Tax=Macrostomum lignano TaxID=282301 RepID=A0A267GSN2_9PLAT|nr:hypothetical protein BOX15_Mlig023358g1 [Macrostomum lignano]
MPSAVEAEQSIYCDESGKQNQTDVILDANEDTSSSSAEDANEDEECNGESASGDDGSDIEDESASTASSSTSEEESVADFQADLPTPAVVPAASPATAAAFFIDFGDDQDAKSTSTTAGSRSSALQKSFQTYLRRKKKDLKRERKLAKKLQLTRLRDPDRMWSLRMKFLDRCRHYFGVPYKRKYWTESDPEYNSPLFLDCCGLVRRVMYDLRKEFGFRIGPWNQAYMFDTLPIRLTEETMQPGDLVFIEAVYYSETAKKQKHNMVHVEVWLGDGPKTIGARWQKGKVQVFDSYKFVSTSYHSQVHHFCSIDTWLQGICRSFCSEHPWKRPSSNPASRSNKYSIFTADKSQQQQQNQQQNPAKKNRQKKKKKKKKHAEQALESTADGAAAEDGAATGKRKCKDCRKKRQSEI